MTEEKMFTKAEVCTSLENTYREGVQDGIKMVREGDVSGGNKDSTVVSQSSYLAAGMVVGYILVMVF